MTVDSSSNGRFKHFGYYIDGGVRVKDRPFTVCENCRTRLWKDTLMDTVYCQSCGLELNSNHSDATRGGVNGGETPPQKITPQNRLRYDNSGVTRLHGGYHEGYRGDGEYEFGSLDDSLVDETF